MNTLYTESPPNVKRRLGFATLLGALAALTMTVAFSNGAEAATPLAGSSISNRATADYKDSAGTDQHATSNEVTTTVTQVGSYTLASSNTKTAAPGTTVYMPHTLTNTGNGSDTFKITLPTAIDGNLSSVTIYPDANQDGQP